MCRLFYELWMKSTKFHPIRVYYVQKMAIIIFKITTFIVQLLQNILVMLDAG